jgi:hypothetical protein
MKTGIQRTIRPIITRGTLQATSSSSFKPSICMIRAFSSSTSAPFVEHLRSAWPSSRAATVPRERDEIHSLPPRTVPDELLKFKLVSTFDHGSAIHYPHMKMNPADFKVALIVSIDDLNLSATEQKIFCQMVGPRFNPGKRIVTLTCNKFPNRIENKRYLIVLLENLLAEMRRLEKVPNKDT